MKSMKGRRRFNIVVFLIFITALLLYLKSMSVVASEKTDSGLEIDNIELMEISEEDVISGAFEPEKYTMEKKYFTTTHVKNMGYWIYRPVLNNSSQLPLVVYMHGSGERGNNLDIVTTVSLPKHLYEGTVTPNCVVISPQCPNNTTWTRLADDVIELICHVISEENIDVTSIGLTGHSLGGNGTWNIANKYPNVFSSLVPVSGTCLYPNEAGKLKDISIWAFHGAKDVTSPYSMITAQKNIVACGGDKITITIFPNKGHIIVDDVYNNPEYDIVNWMALQHRSDLNKCN